MNHLESITRGAAQAIGKDVSKWVWWDLVTGLIECGVGAEEGGGEHWAPLTNYEHAYVLEDALQMNVRYKKMDNGVVVIQVASAHHDGHTMTAIKKGEESIVVRMLAITQFGALHAIMAEDMPRPPGSKEIDHA